MGRLDKPQGWPHGNVVKLRAFNHRCTQINTDFHICVHSFCLPKSGQVVVKLFLLVPNGLT